MRRREEELAVSMHANAANTSASAPGGTVGTLAKKEKKGETEKNESKDKHSGADDARRQSSDESTPRVAASDRDTLAGDEKEKHSGAEDARRQSSDESTPRVAGDALGRTKT